MDFDVYIIHNCIQVDTPPRKIEVLIVHTYMYTHSSWTIKCDDTATEYKNKTQNFNMAI